MRDVIAIVLAGGRVEELSVLTLDRPRAAVPFGGQYRIIDFALSCLMRADIDRVGVVSLYRPSSLIDHLGSGEPWDFIGRGRGIKILPPFDAASGSQWYLGTADAVYKNLNFVRDHSPRDVLVLSGDHIYDLDYARLLEQHRKADADLTLAVKELDPALGRGRFGFAELDEQDRVIGYQEKPQQPRSNLVSLTAYAFRTEVLIERLKESWRDGEAQQIYRDVIPAMVARDRVSAYRYSGYWTYPRSVDTYHRAHMDLIGEEPALSLDKWAVRTRKQLRGLGDMPPARFYDGAECSDSVISPGARISGSVQGSVLSPGVQVEAGAVVKNSVLLHNAIVGASARLDGVVLDKQVVVGEGAHLGAGEQVVPNAGMPKTLSGGLCLVGKNSRIPAGAVVGKNCIVFPEIDEAAWTSKVLEPGQSLGSGEEA